MSDRLNKDSFEDSEFKFVRIVEDTITGTLQVLSRFVYTTLNLLWRPRHIIYTLGLPADQRSAVSRQFTYLALTSFLAISGVRIAALNWNLFMEEFLRGLVAGIFGTRPQEAVEAQRLFLERLAVDVSLSGLLLTTLPLVIAVTLVCRVITKLIRPADVKSSTHLVRMFSYTAGLQFFEMALLACLFVVGLYLGDPDPPLVLGVALLAVIVHLVLAVPWITCRSIGRIVLESSRLRRALASIAFWVINPLILVSFTYGVTTDVPPSSVALRFRVRW